MSDYLTEEEKVEAIKEWWRENGKAVIAGVILGLGALFGWRAWVDYRESRALEASAVYEELRGRLQEGRTEAVAEAAARLREDYAATPYAALASLFEARAAAEAGKLEEAARALEWVMNEARERELQELARLRLARVRVAEGRPEQALSLLEAELPEAYAALADEIRGDAYRAQGRLDQAREAYDRAILASGGAAEYLRMKRDALGGVGDQSS